MPVRAGEMLSTQAGRATRLEALKRTENGHSARDDAVSMVPSALNRENGAVQSLWAKPSGQPRSMLRAAAVAVPRKRGIAGASDASPWWLGLAAHAACGSLPKPAGLRPSISQSPREAGRSDLCSWHQHGSADHSACFAVRVTQLCRISEVCRKLARDAGLVALAAAHAPSDLSPVIAASMQRVWGHAVGAPLSGREKAVPNAAFLIVGQNRAVRSCSCSCLCVQVRC